MFDTIKPMLATAYPSEEGHNLDDKWSLELKFDGFRCLAHWNYGELRLQTRGEKWMTASFPEIGGDFDQKSFVIDGELIAFSKTNQNSRLAYMQKRNNVTNPQKLAVVQNEFPVSYFVFDVLELDGNNFMYNTTLTDRREALDSMGIDDYTNINISERFEAHQFGDAWEYIQKNSLEGLVAKETSAPYIPGARSRNWRKYKW